MEFESGELNVEDPLCMIDSIKYQTFKKSQSVSAHTVTASPAKCFSTSNCMFTCRINSNFPPLLP